MFRLTREVRFAIEPGAAVQTIASNTHAGFPSLTGFGQYFALRITLEGELQPETSYLRNIKEIDQVVRKKGVAIVAQAMQQGVPTVGVPLRLFEQLGDCWPGAELAGLELSLSPFLSVGCVAKEIPMIRLSQKFEFSAAHRLHNPALSDSANRSAFGKCNNPLGHGHNYELQVTLAGELDSTGRLIDVPEFERIVDDAVIKKFDHKFLNEELAEFRDVIPSVENIARIICMLLKPHFTGNARLATVTVWETPKTWCEYGE